jgi:ABC-type multidrug transport system fused ATPase/permease subunit
MSINRLIIAFNQIFFAKTSIGKIYNYLSTSINAPNKSKKSKLSNLQNLKFENIYFSYDNEKNIINNLNFNINKNDLIGIKGRSGSGKTTLIHIITGLLYPKKGKVVLNKKFNYKNKKLNFGLVSQKPFILNDTLKRNIAFGLEDKKIDEIKVKKLIKLMELNDLSDKSSKVLDYVISENASNISLGQAQRISIARCLYFNPDILILDEPTSSLDKKNENIIFNILKKLKSKKTIILVSHNQNIYKFCSKIIDLDNKRQNH